jgi:hypothetical protein
MHSSECINTTQLSLHVSYLAGHGCVLHTRMSWSGFDVLLQSSSLTVPSSFSWHTGRDACVPPPHVAEHGDQSEKTQLYSGTRKGFFLGTVYSYFNPKLRYLPL